MMGPRRTIAKTGRHRRRRPSARMGVGPVRGTTDLPVDGAEAPARAAEGSGSSAPPYAAIAGAVAAAALAMAAGGWYARRRWLR
jgi:hypothetical protein